jgi:hypothetical protein
MAALITAALDYPEPSPPIRRCCLWRDRLRCKCRVQQFANRPNMIGDPERDRWRGAQGFMHAAEIVVRHVWVFSPLN